MKNKFLSLMLMAVLAFSFQAPSAYAVGARQAGASLLLPSVGQAMNGELSARKSKVMIGVEVASLTTIALLGTLVGGGVVWAGIGPLIANHVWSATDAYQSASSNNGAQVAQEYNAAPVTAYQPQMYDAQRTLEYSRQRRFDREQAVRGDLRERMLAAAELGYNS